MGGSEAQREQPSQACCAEPYSQRVREDERGREQRDARHRQPKPARIPRVLTHGTTDGAAHDQPRDESKRRRNEHQSRRFHQQRYRKDDCDAAEKHL
jgi:hypothetical protein